MWIGIYTSTQSHTERCYHISRWEDAIRVAEGARHPDAEGLKQRYYKWLIETGQVCVCVCVRVWSRTYLSHPHISHL